MRPEMGRSEHSSLQTRADNEGVKRISFMMRKSPNLP
jgi:hypothetical protein